MNIWDARFLGLAKHYASWSKDPSTKVGAVITDGYNTQISQGYNGFPAKIKDDERLNERTSKYPRIIHAECNAILTAARPLFDCTMYIWPFMPCPQCAAMAIKVGILRIVAPRTSPEHYDRWGELFSISEDMLREAGVNLVLIG